MFDVSKMPWVAISVNPVERFDLHALKQRLELGIAFANTQISVEKSKESHFSKRWNRPENKPFSLSRTFPSSKNRVASTSIFKQSQVGRLCPGCWFSQMHSCVAGIFFSSIFGNMLYFCEKTQNKNEDLSRFGKGDKFRRLWYLSVRNLELFREFPFHVSSNVDLTAWTCLFICIYFSTKHIFPCWDSNQVMSAAEESWWKRNTLVTPLGSPAKEVRMNGLFPPWILI